MDKHFFKNGIKNWDEFFSPERIRKKWEKRYNEEDTLFQKPEEVIDKLRDKLVSRYRNKKTEIFDSLLEDLKRLFKEFTEKKDANKKANILELIQYMEDLISAFDIEEKFSD